jgi:hypothetical protein
MGRKKAPHAKPLRNFKILALYACLRIFIEWGGNAPWL